PCVYPQYSTLSVGAGVDGLADHRDLLVVGAVGVLEDAAGEFVEQFVDGHLGEGLAVAVLGVHRALLRGSLSVCTLSICSTDTRCQPHRAGQMPAAACRSGRSACQARTLSSAFMICRSEASTPPMTARSMFRSTRLAARTGASWWSQVFTAATTPQAVPRQGSTRSSVRQRRSNWSIFVAASAFERFEFGSGLV